MEFIANFSEVIHLTLWTLTIAGHLYVTDLLNNGVWSSNKLCFEVDVDPEMLGNFLVIGIGLEVYALLKMLTQLFGVDFPRFGCDDRKTSKKSPTIAEVADKIGNIALKSSKSMVMPIIVGIISLFVMTSNLVVYIILINRLKNASTNDDGKKCIQLSESEYSYIKPMIYMNWGILIISVFYSTWVDIYCN